jgi:hypothetical protein
VVFLGNLDNGSLIIFNLAKEFFSFLCESFYLNFQAFGFFLVDWVVPSNLMGAPVSPLIFGCLGSEEVVLGTVLYYAVRRHLSDLSGLIERPFLDRCVLLVFFFMGTLLIYIRVKGYISFGGLVASTDRRP